MSRQPQLLDTCCNVTQFFNAKRRVTEAILESVGRTKPSDDTPFQERKARILALEDVLNRFCTSFGRYIDHQRGFCAAASDVGAATRTLYADCSASHAATVEAFAACLDREDTELRKGVDGDLVSGVLEPARAALAEIRSLAPRLRERAMLKVDFDARLRRVSEIKDQGSSAADPHKLADAEDKLARTEAALREATAALYAAFDALEAQRHAVMGPSLRLFARLQASFFADGVRLAAALPFVPDMAAAVPAAPALPPLRHGGGVQPAPSSTAQAQAVAPAGASGAASAGSASSYASGSAAVSKAAPASAPVASASVASGGSSGGGGDLVRARFAYNASGSDELSLRAGDVVAVTQRHSDGWWVGRCTDGRTGAFPGNYTAPVAPGGEAASTPELAAENPR